MKDLASMRQRAIALMREAIALLDEAGEAHAAVHLQAAIDAAEPKAPLKPGEELPDENLAVSAPASFRSDPALVRAMGGALALIATVMTRQGGVSLDEVADLLGMYAGVTNETSADEGLILACWVAMLRDVAAAQRG